MGFGIGGCRVIRGSRLRYQAWESGFGIDEGSKDEECSCLFQRVSGRAASNPEVPTPDPQASTLKSDG